MVRIALDAMGGDHAPEAIVGGAIEAAQRADGRYEIVLVGDKPTIESELQKYKNIEKLNISIEHASQVVEMHEAPGMALRKKPDSSIAVCMRLQKEGRAEAMVSAGNTGAVMAAALFVLKRIPGVQRPAIGSFLPHESGVCVMLDVGSNVDCKPDQLQQFGVMGSIFANHVMGLESPRVGIINIGEETSKGNEATQQAHEQLAQTKQINFIGNVEGRDIMRGVADVVVCDGFVGNILLKFGESIARMIAEGLKEEIGSDIRGKLGALLLLPHMKRLLGKFDYQEYGGAPLLGVKGNCIICHGSSSPKAIKNAVEEAYRMIQENVNSLIEEQVHATQR